MHSAWLEFFSGLAIFGCVVVFVGVVLEGAENLIKFKSRLKWRRWVASVFGESWRTRLVLAARYVKPKLFPFEAIGFGLLVIGLAVETLSGLAVDTLQSEANAELKREASFANDRAMSNEVLAKQLELQVMEASNSIIKNDVRNWPISEVNAVAWFTVMGTNDDELTNLPSGRKAEMTLWKNEREGFSLDTLEAGNGDVWGHVFRPSFGLVDRRIYRVQLHSFNFLIAAGVNPPPVRTIDDVHLVHVELNFLPRDSEIANGRVILTVNNVTKYFDVPSQNNTNSNMGGHNDFVCWFVATNGVRSAEREFLYLRN
jgi:hypothetical protein